MHHDFMAATQKGTRLKSSQIQSYVEDGYLILPALLSENDVLTIRNQAVKFGRAQYETMGIPGDDSSDPRRLQTSRDLAPEGFPTIHSRNLAIKQH